MAPRGQQVSSRQWAAGSPALLSLARAAAGCFRPQSFICCSSQGAAGTVAPAREGDRGTPLPADQLSLSGVLQRWVRPRQPRAPRAAAAGRQPWAAAGSPQRGAGLRLPVLGKPQPGGGVTAILAEADRAGRAPGCLGEATGRAELAPGRGRAGQGRLQLQAGVRVRANERHQPPGQPSRCARSSRQVSAAQQALPGQERCLTLHGALGVQAAAPRCRRGENQPQLRTQPYPIPARPGGRTPGMAGAGRDATRRAGAAQGVGAGG